MTDSEQTPAGDDASSKVFLKDERPGTQTLESRVHAEAPMAPVMEAARTTEAPMAPVLEAARTTEETPAPEGFRTVATGAYKSTGPSDSPPPDTLPSQNPAYTSNEDSTSGSPSTASGTVVQNVDGRLVTGYQTDNGGFMSTDRTIYVPPGSAPEYGITDPTTGNFLQGGTTRVIGGQTVYGTVQNGIFVSEDNTLLQLPNGFVEHGTTDASGDFQAYAVVDGQQVSGNYDDNGDFQASDGRIYIPAGAAPEHGITDPTTGNFLPGGSTRVIDGQTVYGTVQNGIFVSEDNTLLQLPNGFVEHGTTDASGDFHPYAIVDGQQVSGNYDDDGDFQSSDGTIYIPAGGAPEHGITDPTTGYFLEGGSTRVIDGQTVYGTVDGSGDFLSADGTILQLPGGFVEHGVIVGNSFIAEVTVNGKVVQGNYDAGGDFQSLDGTVYIPAGAAPEIGVTDPKTNTFLPGATTYTLPDGTVLYGYKEPDGSFWSYDGSEIVLSNGTAVAGSLQKGDGVFTGNNGSFYFVGQNGITQVTQNPDGDGSYVMPDGSVVMTPQSWKTDLEDFQTAQSQIATYISNISGDYDTIQMQYSMIESYWTSPAGTSFQEATSAVDLTMQQLNTVLSSISSAMQASYDNYYSSEQQAIATFNAANSGGSGSSGS